MHQTNQPYLWCIRGETLLHVLAKKGYSGLFVGLVKGHYSNDCNPRDDQGVTPLHLAAKDNRDQSSVFGSVPIVQFLVDRLQTQEAALQDMFGKTPLHYAASRYGYYY